MEQTLGLLLFVIIGVRCCGGIGFLDFQYLLKPDTVASQFFGGLILVHSAPDHFELRRAIRQTWGGVEGYQTVFLLGQPVEAGIQAQIEEEAAKSQDIVQGSFVDAYRNLTYKHLFGYKYAVDSLPNAAFILKSDDDLAVDTFHLQKYLDTYVPEKKTGDPFLLCDPVENNKPQRNPASKWFVTADEYPLPAYPLFCSGWAYVTNAAAASLVLTRAAEEKEKEDRGPFWIDDVYVTGMLRPPGIPVYDWSNFNLRMHAHYTRAVLQGRFFSPELMVASDLRPDEIRTLFRKFRESRDKGWAEAAIYGDPRAVELLQPRMVAGGEGTHRGRRKREEL